MIKVQFKVRPNLIVEVEGRDQKGLFEELASIQEVFGQKACGKCKSDDLRFSVRDVDGNKFYEVVCNSCRAKLAFGCHKQSPTLFPKRSEEDESGKKNWLPDGGWVKWDKNEGKNV